jgi:hypothetical protein
MKEDEDEEDEKNRWLSSLYYLTLLVYQNISKVFHKVFTMQDCSGTYSRYKQLHLHDILNPLHPGNAIKQSRKPS